VAIDCTTFLSVRDPHRGMVFDEERRQTSPILDLAGGWSGYADRVHRSFADFWMVGWDVPFAFEVRKRDLIA